mmetsp:Transcript_12942/g.30817  ORF Transcript_12942/g.30817 Transcript_12942/m.30817 type:complete len:367 (+) Transcript_12942:956-2056(+)
MQQNAASLEVTQEGLAEPMPLVRSLQQPWDVSEDHCLPLSAWELCYPQVRHHRREGVVCHLRLGVGDGGEERGLSGVWHADDADVRHELQLQRNPPLLPLLPELRKARRGVFGGLEGHVAAASLPSLGHQQPLPRLTEVADEDVGLGVADDGSQRHLDDEGVGVRAVLPLPSPALPALRHQMQPAAEAGESVVAFVCLEPHIAAVTAVTAKGTPHVNMRLTAKSDLSCTAVASFHVHFRLVIELPVTSPLPPLIPLLAAFGCERWVLLPLMVQLLQCDVLLGHVVGELHPTRVSPLVVVEKAVHRLAVCALCVSEEGIVVLAPTIGSSSRRRRRHEARSIDVGLPKRLSSLFLVRLWRLALSSTQR